MVNGIYKLRAHAHRRGGSMGAYGTSQGGGAWGGGGGLGSTPQLGNLPLRALVCDGAITGWLGYGYLRMRDYGSSLYMPST